MCVWSFEVETDELAPLKCGMLGVNPINLSLWWVCVTCLSGTLYMCWNAAVLEGLEQCFLWPTFDN